MKDFGGIRPVLGWSVMENDIPSEIKMLSRNTGKWDTLEKPMWWTQIREDKQETIVVL